MVLMRALATEPGSAPACDLTQYTALPGLTATVGDAGLIVTWKGDRDSEIRSRYAIENGQPIVRDLAVRQGSGAWATLGENLKPEYRVVTGVRRMSMQQAEPLQAAGVELTPDVITKNRWYAFWDAPLFIPPPPPPGRGTPAPRTVGPPRTESEIRRASASFNSASCAVRTDGSSLAIIFLA